MRRKRWPISMLDIYKIYYVHRDRQSFYKRFILTIKIRVKYIIRIGIKWKAYIIINQKSEQTASAMVFSIVASSMETSRRSLLSRFVTWRCISKWRVHLQDARRCNDDVQWWTIVNGFEARFFPWIVADCLRNYGGSVWKVGVVRFSEFICLIEW